MAKLSGVSIMIVDRETLMASNCGFASSTRAALDLLFPNLAFTNLDDPEILGMVDKCDNVSGSLFVMDPVDDDVVWVHWNIDDLLSEYKSRKTPCNAL